MKRPWAFRTETVDGLKPHPFVQNASDLLLQVIFESKTKRIYVEEAIENQPLEAMIDAMSSATVRSAHALASLNGSLLGQESREVDCGLKRARWSLAQAAAHADLAQHVSAVDPAWLKGLRVEFTRMRKELRRLIHMYEEPKPGSAPAAKADPPETRS